MSLQGLLHEKKAAVVARWLDLLLEDYPPETLRFLKGQRDRFANPVGSIFQEAIAGLYEELVGEGDFTRAAPLLDAIVRIRAVQDFPPSRALAFVPRLKQVVREALGTGVGSLQSPPPPQVRPPAPPEVEPQSGPAMAVSVQPEVARPGPQPGPAMGPEEWRELDDRIDRLTLLAFDVYLGCREKIHEIRFAELRNRTHLLLERAGLVVADTSPDNSGQAPSALAVQDGAPGGGSPPRGGAGRDGRACRRTDEEEG